MKYLENYKTDMSLVDYQKIKVIGKGSYGEVWLAKHRRDKKQVQIVFMRLNIM